ncbi:MAG: Magnesium and cobalt efflux protein CorC [Chlamydiae bacterium]|nr:Magnesium and cobalt efflux protein CorC [Chlamydiota bacterium]
MNLAILLSALIFLIGATFITGLTKSLQILGRIQCKKEFNRKPHLYFAYNFIKRLFSKDPWDNLFYLLSFTKHLLRLLYATTFFFVLITVLFADHAFSLSSLLISIVIVIALALLLDFLFRFILSFNATFFLHFSTPITTFFLLLFSPITFLLLKAQKGLYSNKTDRPLAYTRARVKDKILELVHESELSAYLDPFDRRVISSVASIRDRIVREIMVPRIDIFTLSIDQTVHEAAQKFISEGYSRIPVYEETIDSIVGILLYKDVMAYYFRSIEKNDRSPLDTPLKQLIKPVIYSPETKKISQLLQEFRSKQIHLAIVVDEYGGTEGIVTIEDILEELVGEIADEYDSIEDDQLYSENPDGGWIVDAKMTILDVEKELAIDIPQSPEYDTVGGYVFQRAGTIPSKGWKVHNDNFDLEVLSTNERSIEKVIITPPKLSNH